MKTNFKLTVIILIAIIMLVPTGCSKSAKKENKEEVLQAVKQEAQVSATIELVETDVLRLSEVSYDTDTASECDFDEKVVSYITPSVYIYKIRDVDSEPAGIMLPTNEANIIEIEGDWTYVEFQGRYGYVKNESVLFGKEAFSVASEKGTLRTVLSKDNVKVYTDSDTLSDVKATLKKSQSIDIISEENGMLLIEYDGETGYVTSDSVKETYELEQAMTIEDYNAYLEALRQEELRKQQEAEEIRRKQHEAAVAAGLEKYIPTVQGDAIPLSQEEIWLLACIVKYESGWQEYEGKLAVANVVLNRYKAGADSIASVIYARNQFSGVSDGNGGPSEYFKNNYLNQDLSYNLPQAYADECMQAAVEAASGINNIGDFRFFIGINYAEFSRYSDYKVIGGHCFYKY